MFKIGDKVKVVSTYGWNYIITKIGYEGVITSIGLSRENRECVAVNGFEVAVEDLKLITNNMNIKEKFVLAFQKEPEKSFRKAEITNGDGFLTSDGQQVFLGYLLKKFGDDFKKEVVDDLLKEENK